MRNDIVSPAASVGDAAVQRLERQATGRVPGHERMELASEAIDLDDVPDLDPFKPHPPKVTISVRLVSPG